jgi:hypothetical protein
VNEVMGIRYPGKVENLTDARLLVRLKGLHSMAFGVN